MEELGANPFMLGLKCGNVHDTKTNIFDLAMPEDMIVKVLPHTKAKDEHVEHSKEAYLRKILKNVQPDRDAAQYLIDVCSLSMYGIKSDQIFIIFQGGGSDGKTMMEVLLISMLGEYCVTPDIKILTCNARSAEGADSKLMQCR